jgi:UDP-N-acetylmuramate dehydrogenase
MPELRNFTTIRVGGEPKSFTEVTTERELFDECKKLWATGEDWFVLGGGSNVVFDDQVSELNVIRVVSKGIEVRESGDFVFIKAQAGESWDGLVKYCVANGYAGIEAISGVPGTVGGSPVQNIGAYGQEVSETITRISFLDYQTREELILENEDLNFSYRDSDIKRGRVGAIGWVEFRLQKLDGLSVPMASGQITNYLEKPYGSQLPLTNVRETVLALRSSKGMVIDPKDPNSVSCGSFFTNPVVDYVKNLEFPDEMQKWKMDDESFKLSAGWLIENAGIEKGFSLPGSKAAISQKHALAITNTGGATAAEILELARYVQERVAARWGVNLVPEPNLIGFS